MHSRVQQVAQLLDLALQPKDACRPQRRRVLGSNQPAGQRLRLMLACTFTNREIGRRPAGRGAVQLLGKQAMLTNRWPHRPAGRQRSGLRALALSTGSRHLEGGVRSPGVARVKSA